MHPLHLAPELNREIEQLCALIMPLVSHAVGFVTVIIHQGLLETHAAQLPAKSVRARQSRLEHTCFLQSSAAIACRQLGFDTGIYQAVTSVPANITLRPSWLGRIPCVGVEATISDCGGLAFGDTETCGLNQRLICSSGSGAEPSYPLLMATAQQDAALAVFATVADTGALFTAGFPILSRLRARLRRSMHSVNGVHRPLHLILQQSVESLQESPCAMLALLYAPNAIGVVHVSAHQRQPFPLHTKGIVSSTHARMA
eukprot:jgi/Ulvmu1/3390/UM016_0006.1